MITIALGLFECKRTTLLSLFRRLLTLETTQQPFIPAVPQFAEQQIFAQTRPSVDRTGRPTFSRSTRPVDLNKQRVWLITVRLPGRPRNDLCTLCTSVDRTGRPTLPDSAAAAVFCCCPLCLPSSTSLAISSTRPMAIQQSSQLPR